MWEAIQKLQDNLKRIETDREQTYYILCIALDKCESVLSYNIGLDWGLGDFSIFCSTNWGERNHHQSLFARYIKYKYKLRTIFCFVPFRQRQSWELKRKDDHHTSRKTSRMLIDAPSHHCITFPPWPITFGILLKNSCFFPLDVPNSLNAAAAASRNKSIEMAGFCAIGGITSACPIALNSLVVNVSRNAS